MGNGKWMASVQLNWVHCTIFNYCIYPLSLIDSSLFYLPWVWLRQRLQTHANIWACYFQLRSEPLIQSFNSSLLSCTLFAHTQWSGAQLFYAQTTRQMNYKCWLLSCGRRLLFLCFSIGILISSYLICLHFPSLRHVHSFAGIFFLPLYFSHLEFNFYLVMIVFFFHLSISNRTTIQYIFEPFGFFANR